jgi:exonuclease III
MKKAKWNDKWRALSDMKAARGAAQETILEGLTTGRHGASDATTPKNQTYSVSTPTQQEQMAKIKQLLMEEYIQTFQHQYRSLFTESTDLSYRNYLRRAAGGTQTVSNSASPTETKTENLSVFKDVTTTPKGQLKPST